MQALASALFSTHLLLVGKRRPLSRAQFQHLEMGIVTPAKMDTITRVVSLDCQVGGRVTEAKHSAVSHSEHRPLRLGDQLPFLSLRVHGRLLKLRVQGLLPTEGSRVLSCVGGNIFSDSVDE